MKETTSMAGSEAYVEIFNQVRNSVSTATGTNRTTHDLDQTVPLAPAEADGNSRPCLIGSIVRTSFERRWYRSSDLLSCHCMSFLEPIQLLYSI